MALKDGILTVNDKEIAIAYFRHGYTEEHYTDEILWDLRETIELS